MNRLPSLCSFFVLFVALHPVHATAAPDLLSADVRVDVPVTVLAIEGVLMTELDKGQLGAAHCRWCERHDDGSDAVNPVDGFFRARLRWSNIDAGDTLSSVAGFAATPLVALGLLALAGAHDDALKNLPIDALVVVEATALSTSLNQVVKFSVGRERPFVHVLAEADKLKTAQPSDNYASFYSGHTSLAFSLAVSAGTVASLRGYRWAPWVWVSGLTLATLTGYLRIAGDRHYFTDVLVGAAMGAAVGFLVPYLFHRRLSPLMPGLGASRLPGGAMVSLSWAL